MTTIKKYFFIFFIIYEKVIIVQSYFIIILQHQFIKWKDITYSYEQPRIFRYLIFRIFAVASTSIVTLAMLNIQIEIKVVEVDMLALFKQARTVLKWSNSHQCQEIYYTAFLIIMMFSVVNRQSITGLKEGLNYKWRFGTVVCHQTL